MRKSETFKELIHLYLKGECSRIQFEQLREYLQDPDCVRVLEEMYDLSVSEDEKSLHAESSVIFQKIMSDERVQDSLNKKKTKYRYEKLRYVAAAAVFIAVAYFSFFLLSETSNSPDIEKTDRGITVIVPGGDKALFETYGNVSLDLTELSIGQSFEKDGFLLKKGLDGSLRYSLKKGLQFQKKQAWHTLKTPLGGECQIVLEDGTQVWLNAGSSIEFPYSFDNERRRVKVTGEVYFEVARDVKRPFFVEGEDFSVRVLGTSFNLSNYKERTTTETTPSLALVEGAVQLQSPDGNVTHLKPGQKAFKKRKGFEVMDFDIESELAWKENYFIFKDENIKEIMSSLSRWYNAEVVYVGKGWEDKNYTIRMSRYESLEQVLSLIELTRSIRFKVEERRIFVHNR